MNAILGDCVGRQYVEFDTLRVNLTKRGRGDADLRRHEIIQLLQYESKLERCPKTSLISARQLMICSKTSFKRSILKRGTGMYKFVAFGATPPAYHGFYNSFSNPS